MPRLIVTKLKLTPEALLRLRQLGLSLADLDIVLVMGRKTSDEDKTLYVFDPELVPSAVRVKLRRLAGITILVASGKIVDIQVAPCPQSDAGKGKSEGSANSEPT